jgi:tRNA/rRNA methyltransferase
VSKSELTNDFSRNDVSGVLANVAIVLSHTSHPGNIGAAARAMKTMGLSDLRLVNPDVFPSEIADARASGATDVLQSATLFTRLEDAIADCVYVVGSSARGRDFVGETMDVRSACEHAIEFARTTQLSQSQQTQQSQQSVTDQKIAIVFGCEMSGMTNAEVLLCQTLAYVPANPEYSSLNLGSAVQVFAYELRMAAGLRAGHNASAFQLATQQEIEHLFTHMESTLTATGFFNPHNPKRLFPRLRRLFNRTKLEKEEVDIFRGIFRSINEMSEADTSKKSAAKTQSTTKK